MRWKIACKAFVKAFKNPQKGEEFLDETAPKQVEGTDQSHLRLLNYLQQASRLVDFLKEDLSAFTDAQIGAVARKVHQDCAKAVEELVAIRPLRDEKEGSLIQVPKNYDPSQIKIVGKIKGDGPFTGTLMHGGWKAQKRSLPKKTGEHANDVICPAEIECKA